ncbi:hypothetical protein J7I80_20650 [Bacillus sp. ISL-41]|uniref:hypothetical protein n=1 Tax=Bacillus sp. ISL-41 TaxID=2819127 RepID=UPI001BE7C637|nr:hypothetical protein [Bacillus sp. ISL-41]MBT2644630.1 hypothetical protein [Bacillus sp. ISL-41]
MAISNKDFWRRWNNGEYEEALKCSIKEDKPSGNRLQTMLFGPPDQLKQTGVITAISVGEFIYDYVMINPAVVQGLDFARTEDLSSLFTLSQFAGTIDTETLTGDMAQLQGYVAEQMIAAELQAKGHDVEFPETSNNPGWDILVDGQPFQVKNLADPAGVREHLEKYPDIPVYVNEELAPYFEGNPQVYVSSISRDEVLEATSTTISHADDLLDFEIPWIAAGVSSIYNIKRVWTDEVSINQAVFNVVSDTTSRVVLGALGQKATVIVGTMIFGPAGGVVGAMVGTYAGVSQAGRLSAGIKRTFSKKQEAELNEAMVKLISKVVDQIEEKLKIKDKKMDNLLGNLRESKANDILAKDSQHRFTEERKYLLNRKEELLAISQSIQNRPDNTIQILPQTMATIAKTAVHPVHYQSEIILVQQKSRELSKKM